MTSSAIAGRIVWITGASSGIGAALAVELGGAGANLVLSGRRRAELEQVATACKTPTRPLVLPLDVSRPAELRTAVEEVQRHYGRLDILVNNAGIGQRGLAEDTLPEVERAIMEVNYFGAVGLTRAALPLLLARPGGCVVAVSSVMGYVGLPRRSTYAASKFAMRGWFDSLRAEVANRGLHVCVVCPGYVRTELSQHALSADGSAHGVTDRGPSRGVDAARVARAIRRGIERRRDEVLVGGPETWVVPLRRHFPRLWSGLLRLALARGWF